MSVQDILAQIPAAFRGPGGAVAVLKDGEVVGTKVWGFADMQKRIPVGTDTIFPICSITKHLLCGLVTDLKSNPTEAMKATGLEPSQLFDRELANVLRPELINNSGLTFDNLCNNVSGIRDYWGLTVLWGAEPEQKWSIEQHGPQMLQRLKSFHFEPGTSYSYSNTNYFAIARAVERATGQALTELLQQRIFGPAQMKTASLCADSFTHPGPLIAYEGTEKEGYYPGINRIEWAGDAGAVASLDDMINYERFIDSTRDQPESWYRLNSKQQLFKDGEKSNYGQGLAKMFVGDHVGIGHGGALRGYRLHRVYFHDERLSVVALLNSEHLAANDVCSFVVKKMYNVPEPEKPTCEASSEWAGIYLDPVTELAIIVDVADKVYVNVKYHRAIEKLSTVDARTAKKPDGTFEAKIDGDQLHVYVVGENRRIVANRVAKADVSPTSSDLAGQFHCDEIDSTFNCSGAGSLIYGAFDGFLGSGPIHLMRPLAKDIWALACPRAMDSTPPGDWTIIADRDESGKVTKLRIGCWLARNLEFVRVN